ncbi:hypothetical protein KKC13_09975 [bacterium]|nr:hypothetical protein [bacterium]MBU1956942.1 hypothetical protein [bacterium]
MYNKLLALLILPLFSISVYATDLNNTEAILTQASEATQPIQAELNSIIQGINTQEERITKPLVQEEIVVPKKNIEEKTATKTAVIEIPTVKTSIIEKSIVEKQEDENHTNVGTTDQIESNISVEEKTNETENNETEVKKILNLTKGNSLKGKNIFSKYLKKECETTAYKFAGNYAQEEWEEIAESGKFKETIFKECPNIEKIYKENWSSDLYQFFYEHANDSENIPEC